MYRDPLMSRGHETEFMEVIEKKNKEIDRLKGIDGETDAEICKMIRDKILNFNDAQDLNFLTSALVNMMTVIQKKETIR